MRRAGKYCWIVSGVLDDVTGSVLVLEQAGGCRGG